MLSEAEPLSLMPEIVLARMRVLDLLKEVHRSATTEQEWARIAKALEQVRRLVETEVNTTTALQTVAVQECLDATMKTLETAFESKTGVRAQGEFRDPWEFKGRHAEN